MGVGLGSLLDLCNDQGQVADLAELRNSDGENNQLRPTNRRSKDRMNKTKAKRMFENARREINKAQESSVEAMDATQAEYRWRALNPVYKPLDFNAMGATQFLGEYCYAVFTSRFRTAIVVQHAQAIAKAFKNFDLDALARTDSIDLAVVPIKNERKVKSFLKGAKAIASEGFEAFKARLKEGGMDILGELPWMGPANRQHLAMIIGLADTAKDDVWLRRCAKACEFPSVGAFVFFLAREYDLSQREVDAFLWDYCRRHQDVPSTD